MTVVCKIGLKIWGPPAPEKNGGPKISQFWHDFGHRHNVIANISGLEQAVINWKMALQSTDTPTHAYLTW